MRDNAIVAAFDFDGTISTTDSLRVFVRRTVGLPRFVLGALVSLPWFVCAVLRLIDRGTAKARFLDATLGGWRRDDLERAAQAFAIDELQALLRPEMLSRLRQHHALGHRLVLVSASPGLYLRHWALPAGFVDVLSTELAYEGDGQAARFVGQFAQPNCWGPEKVRRLEQWWGDHPPRELYVYGDSRGDREMAARADHAWIRGQGTLMPMLEQQDTAPGRAS